MNLSKRAKKLTIAGRICFTAGVALICFFDFRLGMGLGLLVLANALVIDGQIIARRAEAARKFEKYQSFKKKGEK